METGVKRIHRKYPPMFGPRMVHRHWHKRPAAQLQQQEVESGGEVGKREVRFGPLLGRRQGLEVLYLAPAGFALVH